MLSRLSRRLFCTARDHHTSHTSELLAKMHTLKSSIVEEQAVLNKLKEQVKIKSKETEQKNKTIHQKRVKLTEDFKKTEQIWIDAKKESNNNKSTAIQSFATHLIELGTHFKQTKNLEGQHHSTDLVEGFDNTARLFFNTLEKFKIKQTEIEEGVKVKSKDQFEVMSHEKAEKNEQKDTVAKVVQQGWEAEGKIIIKPKVILYQ